MVIGQNLYVIVYVIGGKASNSVFAKCQRAQTWCGFAGFEPLNSRIRIIRINRLNALNGVLTYFYRRLYGYAKSYTKSGVLL